jgi:hypothetical protein
MPRTVSSFLSRVEQRWKHEILEMVQLDLSALQTVAAVVGFGIELVLEAL